MGTETKKPKAEPCTNAGLIELLLGLRKEAASELTRDAAIQAQGELDELKVGSEYERHVAWYFSNICSGYGFVIRTVDGLRSRRGWVTPKQLLKHLGGSDEPAYLGIRPSSPHTNWACIDIDIQSRYHPASDKGEGIEPVLDAMRSIGLVSDLQFQSSHSEGIHIWYPLPEPAGTWELANAMEAACQSHNLEIRNGALELRPNKKGYGSQYLAIRAPLTGEGNALWIPDFDLVDELSVLRVKWTEAQERNALSVDRIQETPKEPSSSNRRGQSNKTRKLSITQETLARGFTGRGMTQEIKLASLMVARLVEAIENHEQLNDRAHQLIREAPGYEEYCGHKKAIGSNTYISKKEIQRALDMQPGGYRGTWKESANRERRADARERALQILVKIEAERIIFTSMQEAFSFARQHGGPAKSWWHKPANADFLSRLTVQKSINHKTEQ